MDAVLLYIRLLFGWFILFISLLGWGSIVTLLIERAFKKEIFTIWYKLLVGFVSLEFILQILHLFVPINLVVSIVVIGVGVVVSISLLLNNISIIKNIVNWIIRNYPFVLCFVIIIALIANQTFSGNLLYDFGLYYQQTIKWIENSKLVVGLANIHGRFGYNNSSFLLASLYDGIAIIPQSFRILSSGMILFSLMYSGSKIWDLTVKKRNTFYNIYWSLGFVFLLTFTFYNGGVNLISVSPDLFVSIFEFVIVGILIDMVENREKLLEKFLLLLLLSGGLFCIKLSAAVFVVTSVLVALFILLKSDMLAEMLRNKAFWIVTVFTGICILIWIIRSILLTGFLFYPFPKFEFNVDWSVGLKQAISETDWIKSWARIPHKIPSEVLGNSEWFLPWIKENKTSMNFSLPFLGGILLSILSIFVSKFKCRIIPLLIIPTSSLVFWFITAPDIRFASAVVWIFFILSLIMFIDAFKQESVSVFFVLLIASVFIALSPNEYYYISMSDIRENLESKEVETICHSEICEPKKGDQCWNSDLLCVPDSVPGVNISRDRTGKIVEITKSN